MYDFKIKGAISIHKPLFMPWLPLIARIACSEIYVALDNVQYRKQYFDNRTRIEKWESKELKWLTMQVNNPHLSKMDEVTVCGDQAIKKVIATIESNYSRAPFFRKYWMPIRNTLISVTNDKTSIFDINIELTTALFDLLDIKLPQIIRSSAIYTGIDRNERIIESCKITQKTFFLNGWGKSRTVHDLISLKSYGIVFIGLDRNRVFDLVNNLYLRDGLSMIHVLFMCGDHVIRQNISYIREVYLNEIDKQRDCIQM